jgi:hypothetical protein
MVDIERRVAENVRTWKRGRKERIQNKVATLSQVVGTLSNTCGEISSARGEISDMAERIENLRMEAKESEMHANEIVGGLTADLETVTQQVMADRDQHHEVVMATWTRRDLIEAEVSRLLHESEVHSENLSRESKTVADLDARITERRDIMAISMEGLEKRVWDARLRYMEAVEVLRKNWRLARWSEGLPVNGKLPKGRLRQKLKKQRNVEEEENPVVDENVLKTDSLQDFARELERMSVPFSRSASSFAKTLGAPVLESLFHDTTVQKNKVVLNNLKVMKPSEKRKVEQMKMKAPSLSTQELPGNLPGL